MPAYADDVAVAILKDLLDQKWSLTELNETFVELALRRSHGNVAQASRLLGVSRAQLDYRLHGRKQRQPIVRGA